MESEPDHQQERPETDAAGAAQPPIYLLPYVLAAQQHGATFDALLWASPRTQEARFAAAAQAVEMNGKSVLDVGCGNADFYAFLLERGTRPAHYVGLEAVPELAEGARRRNLPDAMIVEGDFVLEPAKMFVGADVVCFSGSLNTLESGQFYATVRRAYEAAAEALVFNFLCSATLAGRSFLHWHTPRQVLSFARGLTPDVRMIDDYLSGDCTAVLTKPPEKPKATTRKKNRP